MCGTKNPNGARACFPIAVMTSRKTVLGSHAGLVILPVQDLLLYGADTRMNKPGVRDGNWAFRVAAYQKSELDRDREKFLYWNRLYGRTAR